MRAIWSGSISFMLVNIPVKLYSATISESYNFDLLHSTDFSPIRYARVCKSEEKEVPFEEIVRGYQYSKGQYVVIDDEDFKKADAKKTSSISIMEFIPKNEVDAIYMEKPYYLEPEEGAERSYALLLEALKKSNKVGLAKFVLRNKEHLAIINPEENYLILNQLRFKGEIKPADFRKIDEAVELNPQELDLALALIEKLSGHFKPDQYEDTFSKEIGRIIKEKISGKVPSYRGQPPKPTPVPDLMKMLEKSLKEPQKTKV